SVTSPRRNLAHLPVATLVRARRNAGRNDVGWGGRAPMNWARTESGMSANQEIVAMQTVKFNAGDTILSEGEAGSTAFLIKAGSVEVSIGEADRAKSVGTLGAGSVFGEMSLIDPGP